MRKQILTAASALALAAGLTTSAMAFDHNANRHADRVGRSHAGGTHGANARHLNRYARARGFENSGPGWEGGGPRGGFISLGPLGITAACGQRCSQGFSVEAWSR